MKDVYTESIIPIAPRTVDNIIKYALLTLAVASFGLFIVSPLVAVIAMAVFGFLFYRQMSKTDAEYEYIHTNDVFDVDLVTRNSSRRQLLSLQLKQVVLVAPADADEMAAYNRLKAKDYSGNGDEASVYAMVYSKNGEMQKLLLQLDEKMVRSLKQWMPSKVK